MRTTRGYGLVLGLIFGITLGAPVALSGIDSPVATAALRVFVDDAAAQTTTNCDSDIVGIVLGCIAASNDNDSGDGGNANSSGGDGGPGGDGGRGGDGGFASVHDVGNAHADASNLVIVDDVTTGDASGHNVTVDARGATRPVVVLTAGSFVDTGVDVFAPGGNAQAGTTGGYGLNADASGGAGGDGGKGGEGANGGVAAGGDTSAAGDLSVSIPFGIP